MCGQTDHVEGECPQRTQRSTSGKGRSHGSVGFANCTAWANSVSVIGMSADTEFCLQRSMAAFASVSMDDFLGYGIWDTGATGTMAGLDGMQELLQAYERMPPTSSWARRETSPSRSPMERNESVFTCVFPRYFEGADGEINCLGLSFAVFDRSSPILLGMDVASSMDVIIDTKKGTVYSRLLVRYLPTMRMPTGHLAWDLRPTEEDVRARHRTGRVFEKDLAGGVIASRGSGYKSAASCAPSAGSGTRMVPPLKNAPGGPMMRK